MHAICSENGSFAVVHNGIIENYLYLRDYLMNKGKRFASETDTEVVAQLLEYYYNGNILDTIIKVLSKIEGAYALGIICKDDPDTLYAVRKDSPLIIGLGKGENFIASDIPAIIAKTRRTFIMSDGEIATVTKESVWVQDINGTPISKKVFEVNWNAEAAEKGGFEHFMLKEIYEQPKSIRDTMTGRVPKDSHGIEFTELGWTEEEMAGINKIFIAANFP